MGEIVAKVNKFFPTLTEPKLLAELEKQGQLVEVDPGTVIMDMGSYIKMMPLVTKGAIKVTREDEGGGELFLYFLYPGQSCAMTLQCCMAHVPSNVKATAEDYTGFIAVPIESITRWMREYSSWQNFILTTYSDRFNELLYTIDGLIFNRLDARLIDYLNEKARAQNSGIIKATHQDIANDLHTSREVISRLLKQLEKSGKIKLTRNQIELN